MEIWQHARTSRFFTNQDFDPDPEPDRGSEEIVRAVSADGPASRRAGRHRSAERFQFGFPDLRFPGTEPARVRRLRDRQLGVQVRQPEGAASPAFHLPQSELRRHHSNRSVPCRRRAVPPLRNVQQEHRHLLQPLRRSRRPAVEIRRGRVRRARHDLRGSAEGHHPAHRFRQGRRRPAPRPSATSRSRRSSSAKFR